MSKFSLKLKLEVAEAYLRGGTSYRALARSRGVSRGRARMWVRLYRAHGVVGLADKYDHYSAEFKLAVLQRMRKDRLSVTDAAALFNIRSAHCVSLWERLYGEGGFEALQPRKRGRPKAMPDPKDEASRKSRPDTERTQEELIAELNHLRMENAYLKKLEALVRARQTPKGRK